MLQVMLQLKAIGMFEKLNVPIIGVVENMSQFHLLIIVMKNITFLVEGGARKN